MDTAWTGNGLGIVCRVRPLQFIVFRVEEHLQGAGHVDAAHASDIPADKRNSVKRILQKPQHEIVNHVQLARHSLTHIDYVWPFTLVYTPVENVQ